LSRGSFKELPKRFLPLSKQNSIERVSKGSIPISSIGTNVMDSLTEEVLGCLRANKGTSICTDEVLLELSYKCRRVSTLKTAGGFAPMSRSRSSIQKLDVIERDHYVSVWLTSLYRSFIEKRFQEICALGYCFLDIGTDSFKLVRRYRVLRRYRMAAMLISVLWAKLKV